MVKKKPIVISVISIAILILYISCKDSTQRKTSSENQQVASSGDHQYQNIFGDTYFAIGGFMKNKPDSVETGLWQFTKLNTPLVLFGDFSDGMPMKEWQFILKDGRRFASNWKVYKNDMSSCRFSVPFEYEEIIVDSNTFRLRTMNDSLGKVAITIGINNAIVNEEKLTRFRAEVEKGLKLQGFTFIPKGRVIKNGEAAYYFTEFFMKDSLHKNVKFFHICGNLPSKSRFVEFSLYHDGPKEELVKPILDLVVNHLYIANERFYNPYFQ